MRASFGGLCIALLGCSHSAPAGPRAVAGQTLPLRPGWSMALALDGTVAGRPAVVRLAVEEPFSRVTDGCFASPPEVVGQVDTRLLGAGPADGGSPGETLRDSVLAGDVRLGTRSFGDLRALRDQGASCELTLGSEVLIGFVLEVNPGARTVTFHVQAPAAPAFQSEESVSLELTRDPRTDRPSLAVQLDAGTAPLTLPMLLATASRIVEVSADAGRQLSGREVSGRTLALASLGLAPGWALRHVDVAVAPAPGPGSVPMVSGVLGADAWGHYRILLDLRGQRLVLFRRPPPVEGRSGAESWTHLSSDSTPSGTLVRFVSWQMLDRGAVLPLEPARGRLASCRIGLTLSPEDPGLSLEVVVPWEGLAKDLPRCAQELGAVPAWTGELQETASRPCAGSCLYAQDIPSARTVCSCGRGPPPPPPPAVRRAPPPPAPAEAEPTDPGEKPSRKR